MLDALPDLASVSHWAYAIVFAVAVLDALVPLVPSETTAVAAGVLAGTGDLHLALVVGAAAAGAFLGDTTSYGLGRRFGERLTRRVARGPKGRRRLAAAERALDTRGGYLILVARFIPGGRTAATLAAGTTGMATRPFIRYAAFAALAWASYAAVLGYAGGHAFEEKPWRGVAVALAVALGITAVVELARRVRALHANGFAARSRHA